MKKWRSWWCLKNSSLFPAKHMLLNITSRLTHKTEGTRHGLVNLYKDMESCGGYADIQVMWEMLHSSSSHKTHNSVNNSSRRRGPYRMFCFRPS